MSLVAPNEQGFVSVAEIELPQFKPQIKPIKKQKVKLRTSSRNSTKPTVICICGQKTNSMSKIKTIEVAFKNCETCNSYNISFCKTCQTEVEGKNRCHECNRFVKTTTCPDCYGCGFEEEYRVGDYCSFYVSQYSIDEYKKFVGFTGYKSKFYKAKIVEIIKEDTVKIRVKGKEMFVSTADL